MGEIQKMLTGAQILDRVQAEANARSHEVLMHAMDLFRRRSTNKRRDDYDVRRYTALILTKHRLMRKIESLGWDVDTYEKVCERNGQTHVLRGSRISYLDCEIQKIRDARDKRREHWTKYLP